MRHSGEDVDRGIPDDAVGFSLSYIQEIPQFSGGDLRAVIQVVGHRPSACDYIIYHLCLASTTKLPMLKMGKV